MVIIFIFCKMKLKKFISFKSKFWIFVAKNPELERLHDAASRRLADLRMSKQTLTQLKKSKRPMKKREKVDVIDENIAEQNNAELIAEENWTYLENKIKK